MSKNPLSVNFLHFDDATQALQGTGEWLLINSELIKKEIEHLILPKAGTIQFMAGSIKKMDSSGALMVLLLEKKAQEIKSTLTLTDLSKKATHLLDLVRKNIPKESNLPKKPKLNWIGELGKNTLIQLSGMGQFLNFVGKLTFEALRLLSKPSDIRWKALGNIINRTGFFALPIIALLSFMIGVVIAYQMGNQLRNYGANIFIVDLLGLSILREFGPLITAIMVAGRTGSAFTAQLGTMKINQEIDALNTMGVTPSALLILPRIMGLFIALPLLTLWADIFGVLGGIVMANNMLGISAYDFLSRFQTTIPLRALLIGLGKAPVFALLIASIGCYQGMQVEGSADSVGIKTTRSVVLAIFFIIIVDAMFSIIFSKVGI